MPLSQCHGKNAAVKIFGTYIRSMKRVMPYATVFRDSLPFPVTYSFRPKIHRSTTPSTTASSIVLLAPSSLYELEQRQHLPHHVL